MKHRSPFLMAVHQLGLTDQQKQQIHAVIEKSAEQAKANFGSHKGQFQGLMNPGDPNYASAVQAAKDAATARIDQMSQDNTAIYNLLTEDQKAKLPQVLDGMKQHMKEHMQEHHAQKQS
jgi:Spy/CpxP family protein refolding chaperone